MADELGEVTALLLKTSADILQGLCDEYKIVVPGDKLGNQAHLRRLVLRYLNSDTLENSTDGGKAVVEKLLGELRALHDVPALENGNSDSDVDVKVEKSDVVVSTPVVTETLSYHKLRAFKINGSIGAQGQKDTLSYTSLSFQIRQGEHLGYNDYEIYAAVIQAIKPGNSLRDLLEAKGNPDKRTLIKLLRSHFNEKDPGSVYQDLRHCVQKPGQTAHAFCCEAIALREKVTSLSAEEGRPFDPELLTSTFFKAIFTGLKQLNIRMEIQHLLKAETCSDEDLLSEISVATANETERVSKSKSKVEVQKVTADDENDQPKKENNAKKKPKSPTKNEHERLLASIREVSAKVDGFAAMKNQIDQLGAQVAQLQAQPRPGGPGPVNPRPVGPRPGVGSSGAWGFPFDPSHAPVTGIRGAGLRLRGRCAECRTQPFVYCTHCLKCGSSDHRRQDCPN